MESMNRRAAWSFLLALALVVAPVLGCTSSNSPGGTGAKGGAGGASAPGGNGGADAPGAGGSAGPAGTTPVKLIVGQGPIQLTEGSPTTGKLSVAIDRPYSQSITVTIISANPAVARAIPESITFPPNTVMAHVVEVFAPVDDDTVPDSTTLTVFSQETGSATVTVNVDDPDVQALVANPPSVTMTEGRTENVTFRLFKRPASAVVVTLSASATDKLMLGASSLTFDASNFSVPQVVTLTAPQDADAMAEHVNLAATPTGNIPPVTIPVTVIDDDAVNLDISPSSVDLEEGSGKVVTTGAIKVALTRAPATDVTVSVVSSSPGKVTASPPTLTFTSTNYATPQTVTATPVPDDDAADERATLTFSATGVDPAPASRDVGVSIHDSDSQSLKVTPLMLPVMEGASVTFTVALLLKPDGPTTVNIYSQNPGKLEVNPPVLTFNSADFATPKTVTVKALEDDDLVDDQIDVTLRTPTAMKDTNVKVTVTDKDHQSIQLIPAGGGTSLVMQETRLGGATSISTVGVRLAYRPASNITVNLTSSNSDKLGFTPTTLTFSPSDYSVPKFATLAAAHDIDMIDDLVLFSASTIDIQAASLPVTIIDTDVLALDLSATPNPLTVTESYFPMMGSSAPLNVKLTVQPTTSVTVTFTSSSPKVTVAPATCIIPGGATSGNAYLMGCPGTMVTAVPDDDGRNETATITVSADGLTSRTVPVVVTDNDVQELVVPPATPAITIGEGMTMTFSVGLKLNPVVPVSVNVYSDTPAHFDVTPSTLTFSTKAPQMVTVRALNDDDMQDYTGKIVVQGASAGVQTPSNVNVAEVNSDKQAIVLSSGPALTLLENTMTQIGVHLTYRPDPTKSDTVTLSSSDTDKLAVVGTAPIFTSQDYLTNKPVTLSALRDHNVGAGKVTLTAASDQTGALAASPVPVMVTITDIDALNFTVTKAAVGPLAEMGNGTAMFDVSLTANPPRAVTVKVDSSLPDSVGAKFGSSDTCMLTDMTSVCTVTVTARTDLNAQNESATITISDSSSPGQNIAPVTVSVSTLDKDVQQIDLMPGGDMVIDEPPHDGTNPAGTTTTFKVSLHAQPPSDGTPVNVTWLPLPALNNDGIVISPTQLTFDKTNYSTPQTVTIKGIADNDLRTDAFSVRLSAPTLGIPDRFLNVTEVDKDTQEIVVSKAVMDDGGNWTCNGTIVPPGQPIQSVKEGTGVPTAFCANLRYEPLTNTVVDAVASLGNLNVVTPMMVPLSFTITADGANGYATPHLVKIFATSDNTATGDLSASVILSSSGFAATRSVLFTVEDQQRQGLILSLTGNGPMITTPVDVAPGPVTLKLRLAFRPSSDVNVSCGLESTLAHVSLAVRDYVLRNTTPQDVVISTMPVSTSTVETGQLTCLASPLSAAVTLNAVPTIP